MDEAPRLYVSITTPPGNVHLQSSFQLTDSPEGGPCGAGVLIRCLPPSVPLKHLPGAHPGRAGLPLQLDVSGLQAAGATS